MPVLTALLALGCGRPCEDVLGATNDGVDPDLVADAYTRALERRGWMEHQCLRHLIVTEAARPGGEAWRSPWGWEVAVHPEDAVGPALDARICETYALEHRPHLTTSVFGQGPDAYDAFVQACVDGPIAAVFPEQAVACGQVPLTPQQEFLDAQVFTGAQVPRAPDRPVLAGDPVLRRPSWRGYDIPTMRFTASERLQILPWAAGDAVIEVDGLQGSDDIALPFAAVSWNLVGADDDRVVAAPYGRYVPDGGFTIDAIWTFDRRTRVWSSATVDWPDDVPVYNSASALVGDHAVIASTPRLPGPGRLAVVPLTGGAVRVLDAPDPPPGVLYTGVYGLWPDPTRPGEVVARVTWQDVYRSDPTFIAFHGYAAARIGLDTGGSTMLGLPEDPLVRVHGVASTGELVWTTSVGGGALIGTWDGERRVVPGVCSGWPLVLGDTLVVTTPVGDTLTERWDPYVLR